MELINRLSRIEACLPLGPRGGHQKGGDCCVPGEGVGHVGVHGIVQQTRSSPRCTNRAEARQV